MRPIENTEDHFGFIAILFHWSMALLVIGLAGLGLYMVTLPDVGFDTIKIILILYHKQFGILVLVLLVARLAWRVTNLLPQLVAHLPDWMLGPVGSRSLGTGARVLPVANSLMLSHE